MSGMYDLYPVRLSSRNTFLHVTPEEEEAASPMRHLGRIACPVAVASADEDTPEFKRQSEVFANALQGMGQLASRTIAFNANHFQEDDRLGQPDSEISRALFSLMGIDAGRHFLNRPMARSPIGTLVAPVATSSAITAPVPGPSWKPWVEKPNWWNTPSEVALGPTTGMPSGM